MTIRQLEELSGTFVGQISDACTEKNQVLGTNENGVRDNGINAHLFYVIFQKVAKNIVII